MTPDLIQMAREAGSVILPSGEVIFHSKASITRFATLVGNVKLEEAAVESLKPHPYFSDGCTPNEVAEAIRKLKDI